MMGRLAFLLTRGLTLATFALKRRYLHSALLIAALFPAEVMANLPEVPPSPLPICYRSVSHIVVLTFAICNEERGTAVRGVLRGKAGFGVVITRDTGIGDSASIERVDSVDLSVQNNSESVNVSSFGLLHTIGKNPGKSIKPQEIPAWAIEFVEVHWDALATYKSLPGFVGIQRIRAEKVRREQQARLDRERAEQERATQAALQNQRDEQSRVEEQSALRSQLDNLDAGGLFARADEFLSENQPMRARVALRLLLSKFPNHALAATAAQQLTQLAQNAAVAGSSTAGASGTSSAEAGNAAGLVDVCASPRVPDFIAQRWGRFSRPGVRKVYSDTIKPFDISYAEHSRTMTRAQLLADIRANLTNWRSQQPVAASNYCKMSAGCSDGAALARTWPTSLPSDLPNPSGPSTLESLAGAYVAMGIGIDYFTLYEKYLMCPGR